MSEKEKSTMVNNSIGGGYRGSSLTSRKSGAAALLKGGAV